MKTDTKIQQLKKNLNSSNNTLVLKTLQQIRKTGSSKITSNLIHLLCSTKDNKIKLEITNIINDLKDKESIPIIIQAIEDKCNDENLKVLVSACWQCGLDFGSYLSTFVKILIKEDYQTAFEAFTVIEESIENTPSKEIDLIVSELKSSIHSVSNDKQLLISKLIKILQTQ